MPKDLQVVKSNHIVSASYRLSVAEQRVILSCIAQLRRDEPVTDEVLYSVKASDLAELCGTDPNTAYRDLAAAAERLFERRITILYEPNGKPRAAQKRLTRWVQDVVYIPGEGRIELRFGKTILPFLTGLTEQFTRYQLSSVAKMTSAHAIRLFELLAQYGSVGSREVAIDQFREWLELEGRYPSIKDLKVRVIDPAITQINEHSPLEVSWTQRKTGRKVTHLTFKFGPKKALQKASEKHHKAVHKTITEMELSRLARPGESREQALRRLKASVSA